MRVIFTILIFVLCSCSKEVIQEPAQENPFIYNGRVEIEGDDYSDPDGGEWLEYLAEREMISMVYWGKGNPDTIYAESWRDPADLLYHDFTYNPREIGFLIVPKDSTISVILTRY